jgi:predicted transcriptional regulator
MEQILNSKKRTQMEVFAEILEICRHPVTRYKVLSINLRFYK